MNPLLVALLALGVPSAPARTAPRVVALQKGRIVQVWPSVPAPRVIVPHALRPDARPFGPHPGEAKVFRPVAGGDPFDPRWTERAATPADRASGAFLLARPGSSAPRPR
jgi:hypothetical protein